MAEKKAEVKWSDVKRRLQSLEGAELVALIQGLFKLSVENRAFLAAHVLGASASQKLLHPYRERIERAFYTRGGRPQLKLSEGRKAIREYQAATTDPAGSLELMLTFVETGTYFTNEFGDIDEPFYNSLSSVLGEMDQILKGEGGRGAVPAHTGSRAGTTQGGRPNRLGLRRRDPPDGRGVGGASRGRVAVDRRGVAPRFPPCDGGVFLFDQQPSYRGPAGSRTRSSALTRAACCHNTSRPCELRRPDLNRRGTAYETVLGTELQSTPQ